MSYGNQTRPASRASGFNPLLLIVVGVVVFWFLSTNRQLDVPSGNQGRSFPRPADQFPIDEPDQAVGDGWQMEEMDAVQSSQPKSNGGFDTAGTTDKRSEQGDWSMSELQAKQQSGNKPANPKKIEQGDWTIEEVDRK